MLPRRRAVATCLTGVLALLTVAPAAAATLEGSAFLDRDGDGVLSAGDAPVAGALVALGATHFTRTDAAGRYTLEVGDGADGILWVSVPATGAPGPAWAPVRAARGEVSVDLAIVPVDPAAAATPLTFVVAADAHMDGVAGRWSADELTAALVQALALPAPPRFFTIVGDITQANRPEDFAAVNRGLDAITVPWVPVPGNHDWYDGGAAWRATWGPDAYSFDVGAVHVVVWNSSAPLDETLALLREDLRAVAPEATVIALGHEPPTDGLAAAMRRLGVDALFTGHWHANRVVDHDGLLELNTQPLLMGGIDLTPAGYRIVTIEEDDLRVDHHSVVSAPVLHVAWPTDERCHRGALDLLVAAGAGAGLDAVRATIGDATIALTPAGGWLWRGRLPARADGLDRVEVVALAGGREVARTDAPIFVCDPALSDGPAPRAGDWPQVQGGPEHRGATRLEPTLPLAHVWAAAVGGHVHQGGPVVADGRVFVPVRDLAAGDRGGLVALSLATGAELWRVTTATPVRNSAAVADGVVVVATEDGRLRALDARTGASRWRVELADGLDRTQAALWAAPAIHDGVVHAGVQRRVAAIDLATGATRWRADAVPDGSWLGSAAALVVTEALVIGAFNRTAGLTAWSRLDGAVRWQVSSDDVTAINGTPLVADGLVMFGNVWGDAVALDAATGALRWKTPLVDDGHDWAYAIAASAAYADGRLFVATQWDRLVALDAVTGRLLWSQRARVGPLRPAHYRGVQAGFQAGPVVAGALVFFADTSGLLRGVDAATGDERWRFDLGVPVLGGLALAGDLLLVPTWDGAVHAFGPAPPRPRAPGRDQAACPLRAFDAVLVLAVLGALARRRGARRRRALPISTS